MHRAEPHLLGPGDTTHIAGGEGGPMELALHAARTGGRMTTFVAEVAPGQGPPLHWHEAQDEAWYVIDGDLRFRIGDDVQQVAAGTWAFVPRGVPHCFQNVGRGHARLVTIFTPGGMEPFLEAFDDVPAGEGRADAFRRLGETVGMHTVGPPLAVSHPT